MLNRIGLIVAAFGTVASTAGATASSHGPIISVITPNQATVWVRTATASDVAVEYGEPGLPFNVTPSVTTSAGSDFTAQLRLSLFPSTTYEYRIVVNGTASPLTHTFRSAPLEHDPSPVTIAVFCDAWRDKPFPGALTVSLMDPTLALTVR